MDAEFEGEDALAATADLSGRYTYVARVSPRSRAKIGEALQLAVDTSRFHFFDPASGSAVRD
jgi:multiple sugar transport system ATP-binding protein